MNELLEKQLDELEEDDFEGGGECNNEYEFD